MADPAATGGDDEFPVTDGGGGRGANSLTIRPAQGGTDLFLFAPVTETLRIRLQYL